MIVTPTLEPLSNPIGATARFLNLEIAGSKAFRTDLDCMGPELEGTH